MMRGGSFTGLTAVLRNGQRSRPHTPPQFHGCGASALDAAARPAVGGFQISQTASDRGVYRGFRVRDGSAGDRGGWRAALRCRGRCGPDGVVAGTRVARGAVLEPRCTRAAGDGGGGDTQRTATVAAVAVREPSPGALRRADLSRRAGEVGAVLGGGGDTQRTARVAALAVREPSPGALQRADLSRRAGEVGAVLGGGGDTQRTATVAALAVREPSPGALRRADLSRRAGEVGAVLGGGGDTQRTATVAALAVREPSPGALRRADLSRRAGEVGVGVGGAVMLVTSWRRLCR